MIDYTLTRSKRKTIAIYVREGMVEVRAPLKTPIRDIDKFVALKEQWILEKLAKLNRQATKRESFVLSYGDCVTYRGRLIEIVAVAGKRSDFDGERFCIPPNLSSEEIKHNCIKIYKQLAKYDLTQKTQWYSRIMSVTPNAIKINSAKTRWGSCSNKKSLNFSWRLIMASDDVIDYVVVHELAHILQLNHSKKFWSIVESVLPDYKLRQKRLKELQHRLNNENWD